MTCGSNLVNNFGGGGDSFVWLMLQFFPWKAGNNYRQWTVSFFITWRSSRHFCTITASDYIYKTAFSTLTKAASVSNKEIHGLVSRQFHNNYAHQILVATHRLRNSGLRNNCVLNQQFSFFFRNNSTPPLSLTHTSLFSSFVSSSAPCPHTANKRGHYYF